MATLVSALIIIVCVLLVLVVLIQNSKGGGLASSFSSSNQVMGVRKTADFLEKATWTLAIALIVLCLISTSFGNKQAGDTSNGAGSATRRVADQAGATAPAGKAAAPLKPTATPGAAAPVTAPPAPDSKKP